jgi:hypothetical protein
MKFYITEETKQELEAKIAEREQFSPMDTFEDYTNFGKKCLLKEILKSSVVLPVEESWICTPMGTNECELVLPNGVIIQPKQ